MIEIEKHSTFTLSFKGRKIFTVNVSPLYFRTTRIGPCKDVTLGDCTYKKDDISEGKYGMTPGCKGCRFSLGKATYQVAHSAECRKRIMRLMK